MHLNEVCTKYVKLDKSMHVLVRLHERSQGTKRVPTRLSSVTEAVEPHRQRQTHA